MIRDPRIDLYIAKAAPFARPCLEKLREIVHAFCPDVEETIKWGMPYFLYKGKILCSMASFKQHCSFGFWLHYEMNDNYGLFKRMEEGGMGSIGKIQKMEDIPSTNQLGAYLLEAMQLTDAGVKPSKAKIESAKLQVPKELEEELNKHPIAKQHFDQMSPSHKKEYISWISSAKRKETRDKRLETTLANLLEGKSKEWKYQ